MDRIKNIKDLAILAGVSAGTVSRALAGSELISLRTRERITAIADEHGFRPNVLARNLRIQKTSAIGVVVPLRHEAGSQISDPFYITMLGLLADALTARGYDLMLSRVFPTNEQWLYHFVSSGRVDGVVLIGQSDQSETIEEVAGRFRPLVVWGGHVAGQRACTVGSDNRLGGALAARHLIERGCRKLVFVGDPRAVEPGLRLEGFLDAIRESGIGGQPVVMSNRPDFSEVFSGASERPDGIFAASDVIAANVLVGVAHAGLAAPADIKVIGYDGLPLGEQVAPRLTTVDQNITKGASQMVDLLLRRIGGEDTESVVLPPRLIVRDST